jgi:hypothetical protein
MPSPTPPTSLRGYVDDAVAFGGILSDFSDNIGDCLFPQSIATYQMMRKHPQLAAVEKAYVLPIRRATWMVNPAGCRPEVVQLVADDFGLPIAGKDDPTAARTRGVSWSDHLRLALLCLPFGFSAFEMLAEMRDSQARLVELSERLPGTVQEFHTDKVGRLTGISQDWLPGHKRGGPQIKADRLVLYTREREGAAYWGNSILRPAFPAWFLSREMVKVHATANRRFGMGVPVVRALPGVSETPGQAAAAAQMAQAARVGESGGAALPPGYVMELIGLSGGTPDTLGFLRYLDQAMARQALAGFIDLGTTETGSRALAGEFIDLFLLAITSEALAVADVVTRQAAARVVAWNFGEDEPVPLVQVSDVGSKHDITAEALNLLLQSGALSADPGLEAQVRRMYRLPEREDVGGRSTPSGRVFEHDLNSGVLTRNERRAQIGLPPIAGGDTLADPKVPQLTPVAAKAKRSRRQPEGQLSLPIAASAEDDAERVQAEWAAAVAAALAAWPLLSGPMVAELVALAAAAVMSGDVGGLAGLTVSAEVVEALVADLAARMTTLAGHAATQVVVEAAAQGVTVEPVTPDEGRLAQVAAVTASLLAAGYASAAARRAMNTPAEAVAETVRAALTEMGAAERGMVADHLSAAMSTAQGAGRLAVLEANPPAMLRASEVNDKSECAACKETDGRTYASLAEAAADYGPAGMVRCAGGTRCRGFLVPIWD